MKIGLKLWSVNTDFYLQEAVRLYDRRVYDYIELYVVPDTLETLSAWQKVKVPFILHNAHSMHGFNLAKRENAKRNREIYEQTAKFADGLDAEYIIFHGGMDGDVEEAAGQMEALHESRALIENKPFVALPNKLGLEFCRGATIEELKLIKDAAKCGFCLDFGHAVCSAVSQGKEPYAFIKELMDLKPSMFHLSDVTDMSSPYDAHLHLGTGELDIARLKKEILLPDAQISIETNKDSRENLNDFEEDVVCLKKL